MLPTVSINLCCYNSEKYLEETLQSIFAQTYKDWELVVINDGSTDSTEQIIQKYINDGWPIIYHYQANAGLGASRNKAIELSKGVFIAIIDHDDLWLPIKLEKQMTIFAESPHVGLVYSEGSVLFLDEKEELYSRYNGYRYYRGNVLVPLVLIDFVLCSSIVARRTIIDAVGWFNTDFVQSEEYDLLLRIAQKCDFEYIDEPLVKYRIHENNASRDVSRMQKEIIQIFQQTIKKVPALSNNLGGTVTRIKQRGLKCELGQAYLLRGALRNAYVWSGSWKAFLMIIPKAIVLYILSLFTFSQVEQIRHFRNLLLMKKR